MRKRKTKEKQDEKSKNEGNLFDKIFKENAETTFLELAAKRLGIKIKSYQPLPEKIQTTQEREADFLNLVKTDDDQELILHIEFQTQSDKEMVYRQAEYHGIELRKYQMQIKHVVIYLGEPLPKMPAQLRDEEIYKGFELIDVHRLDANQLLSSQIPEEIILAILAQFDKSRAEGMIRLLLKNLKNVCQNENELRKYITQLIVYAKLRKLDSLTEKIVEVMPITYDITKDSFYLRGQAKGLEQVNEKVNEKVITLIKNMLKKGTDIKYISEVAEVTQKYVKQIQKEMKYK